MRRACVSEKTAPGLRQLGPARGLLGLEVLDRAVGRDDEHAAEHRPADEDPLVLEVGHEQPRPVAASRSRRAPRGG